MMNPISKKVVIIDDDPSNNQIFKIMLRHLCKPFQPDVTDFTLPAEGVEYLSHLLVSNNEPVFLFLDINMPLLNGWDVLNKLTRLPDTAKKKLTVYMFSSSIDPADEQKANSYVLVDRFLRKPLTPAMTWLKDILTNNATVSSSEAQL